MTGSSANGGSIPDNLTDEAAAWFARMHSDQVTSEDEASFSEWLDADPRHHAAYDEAVATWAGVGALRADPGMRNLLKHLSPEVEAPKNAGRRRWLAGSVAAVSAVAGGVIGWRILFGSETYATEFGEQRRVALSDGSTLTLNTETQVRVALGEHERRIWLDKGQAHFIVAPDRNRPFRVFVGDEEVRALGTRFEVRRDQGRMKVTLEEGSVAIIRDGRTQELAANPSARAQAVLTPGQQAVVAPENIQIAAVDTQRVLAWRFGQMSLDAEPLSDAVAEINRYNTRQIEIEDAELGRMPISGLFQTGSPDAFVDALTRLLPVEVVSQDEHAIRLREKHAS